MTVFGPQAQLEQTPFTPADYYSFTRYKCKRFKTLWNQPVAYALVSMSVDGNPIAEQFYFPALQAHPKVTKLEQIILTPNQTIEAITMNGTVMTTQRSLHLEVQADDSTLTHYELYFFSPKSDYTSPGNLFWNGIRQNIHYVKPAKARGGELKVTDSNITEALMNRDNLQNQFDTMGYSARKAYWDLLRSRPSTLDYKTRSVLLNALNAHSPYRIPRSFRDFMFPEWCHALTKTFHSQQISPQRRNNLGAAPFWMNSQMMVIEVALKWFAKTYTDANILLRTYFNMLNDTDVVKDGEMKASISRGDKKVSVSQTLNPLQVFPSYPQATDGAITAFVINHLLHGKQPDSILIRNHTLKRASFKRTSDEALNQTAINDADNPMNTPTKVAKLN